MKIFRVVIYIAVNLITYSQADIQEIRINENDLKKRILSTNKLKLFTISEIEHVKIIFEGLDVRFLDCGEEGSALRFQIDPNKIEYTNGSTVFYIPSVEKNMSTRWGCSTTDVKSTPGRYLFEVRVKGARKVQVQVDGFQLDFTPSNQSVTEYDGFKELMYEVGETIELTCDHVDYEGSLTLRYYDARDTTILEVKRQPFSRYALTFRPLMRVEYDGSYIDCTYITSNKYKQEFTYRTRFTVKNKADRKNVFFRVSVNGVKLAPLVENGTEKYNYRSIYDLQHLTVTCEYRDRTLLGDILYSASDADSPKAFVEDVGKILPWKRTFLLISPDSGVLEFQCFNSDAIKANSLAAVIKITKSLNREPILTGLPANNILYQYSVNKDDWAIAYQYKDNDVLNLTCISQEYKNVKWFYKYKKIPEEGTSSINHLFNLTHEHNLSNITCEAQTQTNSQKNTIVLYLPHTEFDESKGDKSRLVIIGGVVGAILAVISAVCGFLWFRRNKNIRYVEGHRENFNDNHNPIPPFPRQWEVYDYTYSENLYTYINNDNNYIMTNNSMYSGTPIYASPQKRLTASSNHTENHYTEIDDHLINKIDNPKTTYPSPYEKHNIIRNKPSSSEAYDKLQGYSNIQNKESNKTNRTLHEKDRNKDTTIKKGVDDSYANFQREETNTSYSNLLDVSK